MKRIGALLISMMFIFTTVMTALGNDVPAPGSGSVNTSVELKPTDDTFVQDGSSAENINGSSTTLTVRNNKYKIVYLRFDVSAIKDTLSAAKLVLYKKSGSGDTFKLSVADSDWSEATMKFSNKAVISSEVLTAAAFATADDHVDFDVLSALQGYAGSTITFAVYDTDSPDNNVDFYSKESGTKSPALSLSMSYTPVSSIVNVHGDTHLAIPTEGETTTAQYSADVYDQYNMPCQPQSVSWSVANEDGSDSGGISIDPNGLLTLTPTAGRGNIKIKLSADGASGELIVYAGFSKNKTLELTPTDDTYVTGSSGAATVYGSSEVLTVRSNNYRIAYLKFKISEIAGTVKSAGLILTPAKAAADTFQVSVANSSWSEATMCYNNRPQTIGGVLSSTTFGLDAQTVTFDVTAALTGTQEEYITFVISDSEGAENNISFNSRESAAGRPVLTVNAIYEPALTNIAVNGQNTLLIPEEGQSAAVYHYTAEYTDQYHAPVTGDSCDWSVLNQDGTPCQGITMDQSGNVEVSPDATGGDVKIIAQSGGVTGEYPVTVMTAAQAAAKAAEELELGDLSFIFSNITLPATGAYGTVIEWKSDNTAFLGDDGKITRPTQQQGNQTVKLTATLRSENETATKEFLVTVARQGSEIIKYPDAANTLQGGSGTNVVYPQQITLRYDKYRMGLLKYNLTGLQGQVVSAKVCLDGGRKEVNAAYVADDSWSADTVTYTTKPAIGADIGVGYIGEKNSIELDITDAVKNEMQGDGILSFVLYSTLKDDTTFSFGYRAKLTIEMVYDPVMTSIGVTTMNYKDNFFAKPLQGEMTKHYLATVYDQNGAMLADEPIDWSVENSGARVESLGLLSQIEPWPKSDVVVPVSTVGGSVGKVFVSSGFCGEQAPVPKDILGEGVSIPDDLMGENLKITVSPKSHPEIQCTYNTIVMESMPNSRSHPYLMYGEEDIPAIRERVKTEPLASDYASQKITSNKYSVQDYQPENIYKLLPWRPDLQTFQVPAGAVKTEIGIYLQGKGKVMFDDASLLAIDAPLVDMKNGSFESGLDSPNYWRYSGNGTCEWVQAVSGELTAWSGSRYVRVTNESDDDFSGVVYNDLNLTQGGNYTFTMNVSQLDELPGGTYIVIRFRDASGNYMEDQQVTSEMFNRITFSKRNALPGMSYVYMVEGNMDDAVKAKLYLEYALMDAQWGMQYWINTNENLDDTYQAVHMGRRMNDWAIVYDRIAASGVLSTKEDNFIRSKMYWIAAVLTDTKYFDYTTLHNRRHNYNTDRSNGILSFAVEFPEFKLSPQLYESAIGEILWQLDNSLGSDGGWPESVRYHAAVMSKLFSSGVALKRIGETRISQNENFKKMVRFLINIQTPRDTVSKSYFNGSAYPAVGDTAWGDVRGVLPYAIVAYADSDDPQDIELVETAKYAYQRENSKGIIDYYTDLTKVDSILAKNPGLKSMYLDGVGFSIFRQDYGTPEEDYAFMQVSSPNYLDSHQNPDRGSIMLFMDSTPMMLDPGVGNYTDNSGLWFDRSRAHNMVSFYDSSGVMIDKLSENWGIKEDFYTSDIYDYAKVAIADTGRDSKTGAQSGNVKKHKREFAFVKNGFDILLVVDNIDASVKSTINYHTLSTSAEINNSTATAHCFNAKDLDVSIVQPANATLSLSTGMISGSYPSVNGRVSEQWLMADGQPGEDYFTVLYPKSRGAAGLTITRLYIDGEMSVYKIAKPTGEYIITALNHTESDMAVTVDSDEQLMDMKNLSDVYPPQNKKITLTVKANDMLVLKPASVATPKADKIVITGDVEIEIPSNSGTVSEKYYDAQVLDQFGHSIEDSSVRFSLKYPSDSVSIDEASGKLGVTNKASAGSKAVIVATLGGIRSEFGVNLVGALCVPDAIEITGSPVLGVPDAGIAESAYTAVVKDKFGAVIEGQRVQWDVVGELPDGVSFLPETGETIVENTAAVGAGFILKAASVSNASLFKTWKVTLAESEADSVEINGSGTVAAGQSAVYSANVLSQYGQTLVLARAALSLKNSVSGVTLSQNGILTATKEAAGAVVIVGKYQNKTSEYNVSITPYQKPVQTGGGGGGGGGSGSLTPIVAPQPADAGIFKDLEQVGWAKDAIISLQEKGIVSGKSSDSFAPFDSVTREEFMKMLLRTFDIEAAGGETKLTDVDKNAWYYPYVSAAQSYGIVNGYEDGTFGVGKSISREEICVLIYRTMQKFNIDFQQVREPKEFTDSKDVAGYAAEAVGMMVRMGIVDGHPDGSFAPQQPCTRAECAVLLHRVMNSLGGNAE